MKTTISRSLQPQSVALMLRFAIQSLLRAGMLHQISVGALKDLKGLIDLNYISDTDIELLYSLDSDKIKLLLKSIDTIDDVIERYLNIYRLVEDIGEDRVIEDFAQQFFNPFSWNDKQVYMKGDTADTYFRLLGFIDALIKLEHVGNAEWHNRQVFKNFKKKYARWQGNYPERIYHYGASRIFNGLFLEIQNHLEQVREYEMEENM